MDPKDKDKVPESKTSDDRSRVDVFDGPKEDHDTHSVIHTAADGWTTHDYERVADDQGNQTVVLDTDEYQGNVIGGSEQYDDGYEDQNDQ